MNYRQWKKNYKKQHGYNPPIEDDKRKQQKASIKEFEDLDFNKLANTMRNVISSFFDVLGDSLVTASENAHRIAQSMRTQQTKDNEAALIEESDHEEIIATAGYAEKGDTRQ